MTTDNSDFQTRRTDLSGPTVEQTFLDEQEIDTFDDLSEQITGSLGLALEAFTTSGDCLAQELSRVFEDDMLLDDFLEIKNEVSVSSDAHVKDIVEIFHIVYKDAELDNDTRIHLIGTMIFQEMKKHYEILRYGSHGRIIDPIQKEQATLASVIENIQDVFDIRVADKDALVDTSDMDIITKKLAHFYSQVLATSIGRAVDLAKLPDDPITSLSSIQEQLEAFTEDERPIELLVNLLKAQASVGAHYKSKLFDKYTTDSDAKLYEEILDEIDLDSLRTFSEIYTRQLNEEPPTSQDAEFFASILLDIEKIRFSAARKHYPDCPHCESIQLTASQFLKSVGSALEVTVNESDHDEYDDDDHDHEYDSVAVNRDMMQLFQTRAAEFIDVAELHLPSEYVGKNKIDILVKLGKYGLDILKISLGVLAAIALIEAIKPQK